MSNELSYFEHGSISSQITVYNRYYFSYHYAKHRSQQQKIDALTI